MAIGDWASSDPVPMSVSGSRESSGFSSSSDSDTGTGLSVLFLATITTTELGSSVCLKDLSEDSLVSKFPDVFQSLQGVPPDRSDPFMIELEPGTAPLS